MIRSLELMASFHRMCECDTWEEVTKVTGKSRVEVESIVSELELILGKRLIYRRPEGDVVSSFSGKFFMPTDAGMKWYLLIGGVLKGLESSSVEDSFLHVADNILGLASSNHVTGSIVTFSLFYLGHMQNLRIFTNDFYSYNYLEPALSKMLKKYNGMSFSILSDEAECSKDFDAYFLSYEFPKKEFLSETLAEGRLGLYAHPEYLERLGIPKNLEDLNNHTVFRSRATRSAYSIGVKKFNSIKEYSPIWYKKNYVDVDSSASLIRFAEMGAGIISMNEISAKKLNVKLERLAPLQEETEFLYRKYVFGFHQKHKESPLIVDLVRELHNFFS